MSKPSMISPFAALAGLAVASVVAGAAAGAAAPQQASPDFLIVVESGEANLLHRLPIEYPQRAREKRIEGTVVLEASLDDQGLVSDVRVLSGPEELRRAALLSVLGWHYSKAMALPAKLPVTITFRLNALAGGRGPESAPPLVNQDLGILKAVVIKGLAEPARAELEKRLPVRAGDRLDTELVERIRRVATEMDEHLAVTHHPAPDGTTVLIALRPSPPEAQPPQRIRVGGNVQASQLIDKKPPVYPPAAKLARVQGAVRMSVTIGQDGRVRNLEVLEGHPLLIPSAIEAVKEWVYKPTLLNGQPVEVLTTVDVNFSLLP